MTRWLLYLLPHLLINIVRYPLAVLAVLLCSTRDRRHLTHLRWLETIDNDLAGDSGWREEHLVGSDPLSRINRIRWLWRNGGNALNYGLLGCRWPGLYTHNGPHYWRRMDGRWLYRRFFRVGPRYVEVFLGWALFGPQLKRCKYVATIRVRTKEE